MTRKFSFLLPGEQYPEERITRIPPIESVSEFTRLMTELWQIHQQTTTPHLFQIPISADLSPEDVTEILKEFLRWREKKREGWTIRIQLLPVREKEAL